jgi:hypothetical protein
VQLVKEYGFQPRRKLSVEDGSVLPGKFEPFPSRLYGRPLEEIDNFIYGEVGSSYGNVCVADTPISYTNLIILEGGFIWWHCRPPRLYGAGWYDDNEWQMI